VNGQKTVDLLSEIRHDFGNHLQVIMGYLDLGNPQQARKYIIKLIEEMAAERLIFESTDADTALYLYQQLLLSRELGVILRYDEIKIKSPDLLQLKNEPWHSLQQVLAAWKA
jgi:stage 0 sporulation protein B (sporulation initiation phosphotransferase)